MSQNKRTDARELSREMADDIENEGHYCIRHGFYDKAQRMFKWADELRVEAECVDEDGYVIYQQGHA